MTDFDILSNNTYMIQSNNGNASACIGVKSAQNKGCGDYTYQKENNQYTNLAPLKHDTVNFKGQNKKPEKKMSTFAKIGLGILGLAGVAGIIVAHKHVQPQRLQEEFQKIFLQDFTKDEATQMYKRYKEIYKIKDIDTFLDKMFEQLRKDFKLEKMPLKLDKNFKAGEQVGGLKALAKYQSCYGEGNIILVDKLRAKKAGRGELVSSLTHEMRHARQDLARYQVSTDKELYKMFEQHTKDAFKDDPLSQEDFLEVVQEQYSKCKTFFEKAGFSKITKDDKNYEWGRKQLEAMSTFANKSKTCYDNTFYETDAKSIGKAMQDLICHSLF